MCTLYLLCEYVWLNNKAGRFAPIADFGVSAVEILNLRQLKVWGCKGCMNLWITKLKQLLHSRYWDQRKWNSKLEAVERMRMQRLYEFMNNKAETIAPIADIGVSASGILNLRQLKRWGCKDCMNAWVLSRKYKINWLRYSCAVRQWK